MSEENHIILPLSTKLKLLTYRRIIMPWLVARLRLRKTIDVVFVLSELGVWKTESLYTEMMKHSRFSPHIAVVSSTEDPTAKYLLIEYLKQKKYEYSEIKEDEHIYDYFRADIIFYQKPYWWVIPANQRLGVNARSLFCFVTYGVSTIIEEWSINQPVQLYAWQNYQFNESCGKEFSKLSLIKGRNFRVTGFPVSDSFIHYSKEKEAWKRCEGMCRRIIWAPHHTIPDKKNLLNYSTFLRYADFMLDLTNIFAGQVQFAFKPHPLLRTKLENLWGKEATDKYYNEWATRSNTQVNDGEYLDLFMQSDAMIHDCCSFIVEYMYTDNPVLFLDNGSNHTSNMTSFAKEAFNLQYKASNEAAILQFINDVLANKDSMREERMRYKNNYLIPRNGSACSNIISAILGNKE